MSSNEHDDDYHGGHDRDRNADARGDRGDNGAGHDHGKPTDEVGYGKPPKEGQIKPGEVRNPSGRPLGSKNRTHVPSQQHLFKIILEEARRMVPVNDADGAISIPMAQAIIRSTLIVAAKGNTRAQRLATDLIRTAELETKLERDREIEAALHFKKSWYEELSRRKKLGIKAPPPVPHPDHVVIDLARGCVWIKGPATEEEKEAWARWEHYRDVFMAELRQEQAEREDPSCPDPIALDREIYTTKVTLEIIGYALDGNRDVMSLLEEVFAKLRRTDPEFAGEPDEL